MTDESIFIQSGTLIVSLIALMIALGRVWIARKAADTEIEVMRHELESLREKSDVETRALVNNLMQHCIEDNHELQSSILQSEVERAALQAEFSALKTRIEYLERTITEKDQQISRLLTRE